MIFKLSKNSPLFLTVFATTTYCKTNRQTNSFMLLKINQTKVLSNTEATNFLLNKKLLCLLKNFTFKTIYSIFTIELLCFFPILKIAAQKCNGIALTKWTSGILIQNNLTKKLKFKRNSTDIKYPTCLVAPSATNSKIAIVEAFLNKVLSISALEFNSLSHSKNLTSYFILGPKINNSFIKTFVFLTAAYFAQHNLNYGCWVKHYCFVVKEFFFWIRLILTKTLAKSHRLIYRRLRKKYLVHKILKLRHFKKIFRKKKFLKNIWQSLKYVGSIKTLFYEFKKYAKRYWSFKKYWYLKYFNRRYRLKSYVVKHFTFYRLLSK